jgi:hypothetical protein
MPRICPREQDVLALVSIGQWPRQAEPGLLTHVAGCASCAETVTVAVALFACDPGEVTAPLPDARAVWQRAQWQARQDAMQRAARPVVAMQGVAAVGIIALVVVAAGWLMVSASLIDRVRTMTSGLRTAVGSIGTAAVTVADIFTFEIPGTVVWLLAGAIALGLTAIGVAVALSTLADLQGEPKRR